MVGPECGLCLVGLSLGLDRPDGPPTEAPPVQSLGAHTCEDHAGRIWCRCWGLTRYIRPSFFLEISLSHIHHVVTHKANPEELNVRSDAGCRRLNQTVSLFSTLCITDKAGPDIHIEVNNLPSGLRLRPRFAGRRSGLALSRPWERPVETCRCGRARICRRIIHEDPGS